MPEVLAYFKKSVGCLRYPTAKFILCCIYLHLELTGCALWDVWGDDSVSYQVHEIIHSFCCTSVSVAHALPPTQPSSHKEPADSGEWMGT